LNLFDIIMPYVFAGISVGGQYALISIGFTMVFGMLRLINFAHGDVFMLGGLIMVFVAASLPLYVAIPLVIALIILIGFSIERIAYRPLREAPRQSVMVAAIGVSYLIQNLALYWTGGLNRVYPKIPWISDSIKILGVTTRRVTVVTPVLVLALVFALVWLINNTKIGIAMRAVAKDFNTSQLMGIKINTVISATFVIGAFLAVVGSILFFSSFPSVFPLAGQMPGLKAFVAAVFGGVGSIPGAVIGGLLIGICESLIKGFDTILGPPGLGIIKGQWEMAIFSDAFTFILLIIILVFKPSGLFGEKPTDKV